MKNKECYEDPYLKWCQNNIEEIGKYPDCHLAISLEDGIVIAHNNSKQFAVILDSFPKIKKEKMFITHSCLWLGGIC